MRAARSLKRALSTDVQVIAVGIPLLLGQIVGAIQGDDSLTW